MAIISNNTIRLSNISKSNDRDEIKYCFHTFEETLRETCGKFVCKYINDKDTIKFFSDICYGDLVSRAILNDSLIYYASCFSAESDLLSQWRGYAKDGKGVAIGFYSNNFLVAQDFKNIKFKKITYGMNHVKYELHNYILEKLVKAYKESENASGYSNYENAIDDIISGMVYEAVFYKNPAFKEENEWRLVFYPFGNIRNLLITHKHNYMASNYLFYDRMLETIEYKKDYNGLLREKLSFRTADDKIISYVDMNFESIKQVVLAEIIIGPKANIDDRDLRLFLKANGYDFSKINIKKSSATYR